MYCHPAGARGFRFSRFGVRVPAVAASPLIGAGTVLRSPTGVPFDHAAILATLRDWLTIPASAMLPSRRVKAAPALESLLTRAGPRDALPEVAPRTQPAAAFAVADVPATPVNDLQLRGSRAARPCGAADRNEQGATAPA